MKKLFKFMVWELIMIVVLFYNCFHDGWILYLIEDLAYVFNVGVEEAAFEMLVTLSTILVCVSFTIEDVIWAVMYDAYQALRDFYNKVTKKETA